MRLIERFFLVAAMVALAGAILVANPSPVAAAPYLCDSNNRTACVACSNLGYVGGTLRCCDTTGMPNGQIIWCDAIASCAANESQSELAALTLYE